MVGNWDTGQEIGMFVEVTIPKSVNAQFLLTKI
jgi:hypothetical protein